MSTGEVQGESIIIMDELMQLEIDVNVGMTELKRLTDLYNLGYRYITVDGKPHMGHDNVVNITRHLT